MSSFVGLLRRAKNIVRWNLMSQFQPENVAVHSYEVSIISHLLLCNWKNSVWKDVNPERMACLGLYHECSENMLGDFLGPVKHANQNIRNAIKDLEREIEESLIKKIPAPLSTVMAPYICQNKEGLEAELTKAADEIAAFVKAKEEVEKGNVDFQSAYKNKLLVISELSQKHEEVEYYLEHFLQGMTQNFDDQI